MLDKPHSEATAMSWLLAMRSTLMNQKHVLNKVSLKQKCTKEGRIHWLTEML